MSMMETLKRKRGPYKKYLQFGSVEKVPKRTINNWKLRETIKHRRANGNPSQRTMRKRRGAADEFTYITEESSREAVQSFENNHEHEQLQSFEIDESCSPPRKKKLRSSNDTDAGEYTETLGKDRGVNCDDDSLSTEPNIERIQETENFNREEEVRRFVIDNEDLGSAFTDTRQRLSNGNNLNTSSASNIHSQSLPYPSSSEGADLPPADREDGDTLHGYSIKELIHLLIVLSTKMRHTGTYCEAENMSEMIEIMKEFPDKPQSTYKFKKIVKLLSKSLSIHHICDQCGEYGGEQSEANGDEDDPNGLIICKSCGIGIDVSANWKKGSTFIYLSLRRQLVELFGRHGDSILYSKNRVKESSFAIEDIYDGRIYRKLMGDDMISVNFSVDGVPIFNSSKFGMNPVVCTINELAPEKRPQTMLLCSLYCGNGKVPNMNAYLIPFIRECNELYDSGFTYNYMGQQYSKKCRVLCAVCDAIARRELRNVTLFNGKYGCGFCKHPGLRVSKGDGHVRVYPIDDEGNAFGEGLRTHNETLLHSESLEKGVQGRSILFDAEGFDIIKSLAPDWQHNVALGTVRQFARLWLDSENHQKEFYCGRQIKLIDSILLSFKPTLDVSRTPRKISDRSYWKAHEWVIFLLFYSLPILQQVLPKKYVDHWALLVDAIAILTSRSILPTALNYARHCLRQFVKGVKELYGEEHVSYNVHVLLHLADSVMDWGPLWTHSAFGYENFYQTLLSFVKSSNTPSLQICNSFRLQHVITKLYDMCQPYLSEGQANYVERMIYNKVRPPASLHLKSVALLGKEIVRKLSSEDFLALQRIDVNVQSRALVRYYQRMLNNHEVFHSASYTKPIKRQSFFVLTNNSEIFEVENYIVIGEESKYECYATGYYYERENRSLILNRWLSHMTLLKKKIDSRAAISAHLIKEKVVFIEMKNCNLIVACKHPNRCELLT